MTNPAFETLLDTFEADLDAALASGIEPGCNMPCISVSEKHPGLWAYSVEATATGLISALGDEEARKSDPRFQHLVFFPTWSQGEIAFHCLQPGEKITIDAASDSCLKITGEGSPIDLCFPDKIVVVFHGSLSAEAIEAYYAQEG